MDKAKSDGKNALMKFGEKSFKASLREKFDNSKSSGAGARPKVQRDSTSEYNSSGNKERKHSAPSVPSFQKVGGPTILWKTITKVAAPDKPPKRPPPPVKKDYDAAIAVASSVATSKYADRVKKDVLNDWSAWEKKKDPWEELWDSGPHSNNNSGQPPPVKPRVMSSSTSKLNELQSGLKQNDWNSWAQKIDPWKDNSNSSSLGNITKPPPPVKPRVGVPSSTTTSKFEPQSGRAQNDWSAWEQKTDPWKDNSNSSSYGNISKPPPVKPRVGVPSSSSSTTTSKLYQPQSDRVQSNWSAWDSGYHGDSRNVDDCFTPVTEVDWSEAAPADDTSRPAAVFVRCVYGYVAQQESDLSMNVGDVVEVLKATDKWDDWWEGRINNRVGIFPANHTELMQEEPMFR